MTLIKDDVTQLAFSVYESKGVFALLLGSGLSRAASIPTGWEITLDLIKRSALAQGVEEQPDWATWYRETLGEEPSYSTLLETLASSPAERRAIMHRYIEPDAEDRETGRKVPTAAHHAIASLVADGYIKVIITTNFDRLMENALREKGIEPTVVTSVDGLSGAEPITHSSCYILKLHGDYKDIRILNTESELSGYPAEYNILLDRILDEHGLIVSGWSGEWDHALRAAILRAPNRRYTMYWASRGRLSDGAQQLIDNRRARLVTAGDADSFFTKLNRSVEVLAYSQRQNPASIEILVSSAKRYLSKPEYRIQLDDLLMQETDQLLGKLGTTNFAQPSEWNQEQVRAYVARYEAASEAMAKLCGIMGRWCGSDEGDFPIVMEIIKSLFSHAETSSNGYTGYLALRSYPALLIFTAYGLALTRAGRWATLHKLFSAQLRSKNREASRVVDSLFLWKWKGCDYDQWKYLDGYSQRKTPLSDYLLALFSGWSKVFMGVSSDFEFLFEQFEVLGSLSYFEIEDKAMVQQSLAANPRDGWVWMPVGRSSWHGSSATNIFSQFKSQPLNSSLLKAGFAKGDTEFLEIFQSNYQAISHKMRW